MNKQEQEYQKWIRGEYPTMYIASINLHGSGADNIYFNKEDAFKYLLDAAIDYTAQDIESLTISRLDCEVSERAELWPDAETVFDMFDIDTYIFFHYKPKGKLPMKYTEPIYLCRCNNCMTILHDYNISFFAPTYIVTDDKVEEMYHYGDCIEDTDEDMKGAWVCPICNTDDYLTDYHELPEEEQIYKKA